MRRHDPTVQEVVVEGISLPGPYLAALLRAVADNPHVWRVQLRQVGWRDNYDINDNDDINDDDTMMALQTCVQYAPALIDLDLSHNHLGRGAMQALQRGWQARYHHHHHHHGAATTTTTDNHHHHHHQNICPLQRLNLERNALTPAALQALCAALRTPATPNLQILKLGKNPQCGGVPGVRVLCQELLLRGCPKNEEDGGSENVVNDNHHHHSHYHHTTTTTTTTTITWLDLRGNRLGDAGVALLADALRHDACPLEYLRLSKNRITRTGVHALAAALRHNTRLQTLDLQRNPDVDNASAAALVQALWHNHTFAKLKIRKHTAVTDRTIKHALLELLLLNHTYGPTLARATKMALRRLTRPSENHQLNLWTMPPGWPVDETSLARKDNSDISSNPLTSPPSSSASSASTTVCVICYAAQRDAGHAFGILLPCLHDNACWACCQRLRGHCHMCRTTICKVVVAGVV